MKKNFSCSFCSFSQFVRVVGAHLVLLPKNKKKKYLDNHSCVYQSNCNYFHVMQTNLHTHTHTCLKLLRISDAVDILAKKLCVIV